LSHTYKHTGEVVEDSQVEECPLLSTLDRDDSDSSTEDEDAPPPVLRYHPEDSGSSTEDEDTPPPVRDEAVRIKDEDHDVRIKHEEQDVRIKREEDQDVNLQREDVVMQVAVHLVNMPRDGTVQTAMDILARGIVPAPHSPDVGQDLQAQFEEGMPPSREGSHEHLEVRRIFFNEYENSAVTGQPRTGETA